MEEREAGSKLGAAFTLEGPHDDASVAFFPQWLRAVPLRGPQIFGWRSSKECSMHPGMAVTWVHPPCVAQTPLAADLPPLLFLSQSSVCSKIVQLLGQNEVDYRQKQVVIVSQDSFYRVLTSEQKSKALKGQFNFDHPGEWRTASGLCHALGRKGWSGTPPSSTSKEPCVDTGTVSAWGRNGWLS